MQKLSAKAGKGSTAVCGAASAHAAHAAATGGHLCKGIPPAALCEVDVAGGRPALHDGRHDEVVAQRKLVMDGEGGLIAGVQPPHRPRDGRQRRRRLLRQRMQLPCDLRGK